MKITTTKIHTTSYAASSRDATAKIHTTSYAASSRDAMRGVHGFGPNRSAAIADLRRQMLNPV